MSKIFTPLGASNHTDKERESNDYYATDPIAAEWLLKIEAFDTATPIGECCAGECHRARVFERNGYRVWASDIVKRRDDVDELDFLSPANRYRWNGHIVTNPPYSKGLDVVAKALSLVPDGRKEAVFPKVTFLEGKARRKLFETYPPKTIWVSSSRILRAKNGDFASMKAGGGSAVAYA